MSVENRKPKGRCSQTTQFVTQTGGPRCDSGRKTVSDGEVSPGRAGRAVALAMPLAKTTGIAVLSSGAAAGCGAAQTMQQS